MSHLHIMTKFCLQVCLLFHSIFFLRIGEITVYGKNDENNLRLSSIKFFGNHGIPTCLEITMEHFKWHKSSRPVVLSIAQNTRDPLCACFFSVVKRRNARSPVLSSTKQGHQSHVFSRTLKWAVEFNGYEGKLYKSHSFSFGAATKAVDLRFSEVEIQHMGRWGSNLGYKNYVRILLTKGCTG